MQEARQCGICKDGYDIMRNCKDVDGLLKYYVETIDWSLENGFPTLEQIREMFDTSELERHGVYTDKWFDGETLSEKQAYIFHNCHGHINVAMDYDNANIPMLYFANGCIMDVECNQQNKPAIKVPVYVFGNNDITCYDNENAIFTIYRKEVNHE